MKSASKDRTPRPADETEAEGWLARIFQHEIDHVNGVLFTDHATKVWRPEEPVEDKV